MQTSHFQQFMLPYSMYTNRLYGILQIQLGYTHTYMYIYIYIYHLTTHKIFLFLKVLNILKLGVSMGQSGSGLCPTRNRPNDIGFSTRKPAADRKNQRVRSDRSCWSTVESVEADDDVARDSFWRRSIFFAGFVQKSLDLSKKNQIVIGFL